jgi:hypothetical protein
MKRSILLAALVLCACDFPTTSDGPALSKDEQDAILGLREMCVPVGGCAIITRPKFEEMMRNLHACWKEHSL